MQSFHSAICAKIQSHLLNIILTVVLIGWGGWYPHTAMAAAPDYAKMNMRLVSSYILPGYKTLEKTALATKAQVDKACASANGQRRLEIAFHKLMNAWQHVAHLRVGPIEDENRYFRINFWPDPRNLTARHMRKLLKSADVTLLQAQNFSQQSVAVQGLGAWERVLKNTVTPTRDGQKPVITSCQYQTAIVTSIAAIATQTHWRWQGLYPAGLIGPDDAQPYRTEKELATVFFGTLDILLQSLTDQKLKRPMGVGFEKRKIKRAENYRTQRALQNIGLNIKTLIAMLEIGYFPALSALGAQGLIDSITTKNTALLEQITAMPADMALMFATPGTYARLEKLRRDSVALQKILQVDMAETLRLSQGFNALDGD